MITVLAIILLIFRVVATIFLARVLRAQRELMRRPIDAEIAGFRRDLHFMTIALTVSNIPAIVLDIFFAAQGVGLAWLVVSSTPILAFYASANATSALLAAVLIQRIYKDALKTDQTHPTSDHTLLNDE